MSGLSHETTGASPARRMSSLGRRGWMMAVLAVVGTGTVFNWGWLTAIGAAPLILSLAPCAAVCALGLCMKGGLVFLRGQEHSGGEARPLDGLKPRSMKTRSGSPPGLTAPFSCP